MRSTDRRRFIKVAGGAAIASTIAGCTGSDGNSGNGTNGGSGSGSTETNGGGGSGGNGTNASGNSSGGGESRRIGISQHQAGGSWITAFFESGTRYAEAQGYNLETFIHESSAETQISQVRQMINQDYDGIVLVPFNESLNTVIEEAANSDVPVFTANQDSTSSAIKSFTAFGNRNAGSICGEQMYTALTEQKPDVSPYRVLNVRGEFISSSNARTEGFLSVMDEKDDVNIVNTIQTDWTRADAQSKVQTWLNGNEAPHGVYSSNMTSGLGTFQALERQGLAHPKSNDNHIVTTQLDGGPQVNPKILDGLIDAAVDQPVTYYIPLAIKQMEAYWENGDSSLPEPGSQVNADAFSFDPVEMNNGTLWSEPTWAPASVREKDNHPYVQTNGIVLTEENADQPHLWGNIWG